MSERLARWAAASGLAMACVAMAGLSPSAVQNQTPQLTDVLTRAAAYLEDLGVEPRVASAAADLLAGVDPDEPVGLERSE